ncbi:hypothetical protein ACGFZQ_14880 [Streptomyces sp. NPDC048254]|uniref:hypothetical protein n=1 Tax=Streptomyces sp. NPDC048254 TaxID=3365525 RepID=UPI003713DAC5
MRTGRGPTFPLGGTVAALAATACAPGSPASSGDRPTTPAKIDWKSFKGKELTYVYFTDGAADEKATRSAIARFESETGAKVNLRIVPYANLDTSLQAFGDGYPSQLPPARRRRRRTRAATCSPCPAA